MEKEDARKLSPEAQHERRRQVIKAWKRGTKKARIAEDLGLSYSGVDKIIGRYQAEGRIAPQPRGRRHGVGRRLTEVQEAHIRKLICDNRPEQMKLDFALWNRIAVSQLIAQEFGEELPVRTVGEYLKRWGFTPQKPIRRAYEQRPEAVQAWLDDTYPSIAQRARQEGAEIHWGDETALANTDVRGRGYAPKGQTPVAYTVGGQRHKLSMISTVTNQGKTRWLIIDDAFNADRFIEFLEALIKDAGRKVFLIVDNLRVHHAKPVKAWLEKHTEQIEVFYLPSYSPELNPDERLNADLKYAIGSKVAARTQARLKTVTSQHMTMLEQNPDRVKAYFQDPRVHYAA
jgi:transposase